MVFPGCCGINLDFNGLRVRRWKIYGSGQGFLTLEITVAGRGYDIGFPFDLSV